MSANTPSTPKTWGMTAAEFYAALQGKPVRVELIGGKAFAGELLGVDQYDLMIKQSSGLVLLIPKHAFALLHAAKNGGAQAS